MKGKVWNPIAYDYSVGIEIYDRRDQKVYTEEAARASSKDVQRNLCIRALKVGCYVDSLETVQQRIKNDQKIKF